MKKAIYTKPVTIIASANIETSILAGSPYKYAIYDENGKLIGWGTIKPDEGKGPDAKEQKWGVIDWDDDTNDEASNW